MMKYCKIIFISFLVLQATHSAAQKTIKAEYSGGHACVDLSLKLYSDSTFYFVRSTGMLFTMRSKEKGAYLITDSTISLYQKKRFHFLYFKPENKYVENTYRIRDNHILLYPEEAEHSKDSSFIMAYNTMVLMN